MRPRHRPGLSTRNEPNLSSGQIASFPRAVDLGLAASQASRGSGRVPGGRTVCCSALQGCGRTDCQMRAGSVCLGGTRNTCPLAGLLRAATGTVCCVQCSAACSVGRVPRPRKQAGRAGLVSARGGLFPWVRRRPEQCARCGQWSPCCHHFFVISCHFLPFPAMFCHVGFALGVATSHARPPRNAGWDSGRQAASMPRCCPGPAEGAVMQSVVVARGGKKAVRRR